MYKKIRKAVFPVGGLGTRFLPATKSMPKEMLPVLNKPLIHHAFEEARNAGIEQFIFITGRNKNSINDHFDHAIELENFLEFKNNKDMLFLSKDCLIEPGNIVFLRQQQPLGLGHAVWCARNIIGDEPFAVILADDMFIEDRKCGILTEMIQYFQSDTTANIIGISKINISESKKYGIVKIGDGDIVEDMIEKPEVSDAPSGLAIVGRYILQPDIFYYLKGTEADKGGEIQLTNAMKKMLANSKFRAYRTNAYRLDCGNYLGYLEANVRFSLQNSEFSEPIKEMLKNILG
ncbi:MAG: UTP-glucose-1-phosphate uridylyltransferase [Candidatus Midichloria mitochondrii]|uniref:UTP--glucose-1-phosphate uridylyltransferase n=1 Tax=Midichloria mitochondrii (strain IricVA) TaxID=696127 RepID=F7XWJ0_MIDMI|nr:UTP--glucose-1-phosphate uridylyltransferase [Candidatus Midichloria mitochondrii]AEI89039.1 UTP glucose 1 phosphate uridylyltransferase [Candidatus Midichloria mitochondrii IricVA]MDJ1255903.1 UTP--glucose-1-phosphate uridylyltransferase [Candidatus Midichloria mitochondrii]MDJ1287642.1 UTP--glucose-1-phosphate uridylyltransferase [Candidatus Midichloria mitochondrii]MDJ1298465.1 UTP--glucose-1-phosphate uridylyltransferase [Candidatus Midichloria mitochondrii]MDJ1312538.1 UTP--glucose-1-p